MTIITATFVQFLGKTNSFALARYENGSSIDEVKIGGKFNPLIEKGEWFTADGRWRDGQNPRTGIKEQTFSAYTIQPALPITRKGAYELLSTTFNENTHGAVPKKMEAFVEKYGTSAALRAEKNPELLFQISLDPKLYGDRILRDWSKRISNREAMRVLEGAGIGQNGIREILKIHRGATMDVIRRNPYDLVTIPGVSFDDIDKLGRTMQITSSDPRRVRAVLSHLAAKADGNGHTYVPYADLKEDFKRLQITGESLRPIVLDTSGDVVVKRDANNNVIVQRKSLLSAEERIAKRVAEIMARASTLDTAAIDAVAEEVLAQEKYKNLRNDPTQMAAVRRSVREPISAMTGGPGTGKSKTTEAIAEIAQRIATEVLLAAPSGKAARRQEEATQYKFKAYTVHMLLKSKGREGTLDFLLNKNNPLPAGCFVIIDESSMLDVEVAAALLDALPPDGRILFVGDEEQLRSVGPGNFFGDLMRAKSANGNGVPVSRLEKVHRNSADSKIAHYAREIREGKFSSAKLDDVNRAGVSFYDYPNNRITDKIVALFASGAKKHLFLNPMKDVVAICPKKSGNAGTWQLNQAISRALNPHGREIPGLTRGTGQEKDEPVPRVGDRVMLTENDGDNDVSNGDVGTITHYGKDDQNGKMAVWIELDTGATVAFTIAEAQSLILAYAITGHKSQGSQYPLVIMPMTMDHKNMLDKNLVYTQWTRAQDYLIMVGDKDALEYGVNNVTASLRRTRLQEFLELELEALPPMNNRNVNLERPITPARPVPTSRFSAARRAGAALMPPSTIEAQPETHRKEEPARPQVFPRRFARRPAADLHLQHEEQQEEEYATLTP